MDPKNMLETLENVRDSIDASLAEGVKNRKSDFRTFTFCTSKDVPAGRTVVLRGYDVKNGIITLHSNINAEKIIELNDNPNTCCVFYSRTKKIQIRCFGKGEVNNNNTRSSQAWNKMSDMSKECYFQNPNPGKAIKKYDDFSKNITNEESNAFAVIDIQIQKIDWLYLKREGHRRAYIFINEPSKDTWVSP